MSSVEQEFTRWQFLALASPWRTPVEAKRAELLSTPYSFPFLEAAVTIVNQYREDLQRQPRWAVYEIPLEVIDTDETGRPCLWPLRTTDKESYQKAVEKNLAIYKVTDMDVEDHSLLRQPSITADALSYDADFFHLDLPAIDLMLTASELHDIPEAQTTDVTYDLKVQRKKELEKVEARVAMTMINAAEGVDSSIKQILKEAYLRIATSLKEGEVKKLLGEPTELSEKVDWPKLRKLFGLYERYGYLITAFQIYWPVFQGWVKLSDEEIQIVRNWNREQLAKARARGQDIPVSIRRAILAKNVIFNQGSYIDQAIKQGIPSAQALFNNPLTLRLAASIIETTSGVKIG